MKAVEGTGLFDNLPESPQEKKESKEVLRSVRKEPSFVFNPSEKSSGLFDNLPQGLSDEERAVENAWNELFPEPSKIGPPIPQRKLKEPRASEVTVGVKDLIDKYVIGVPADIWEGGITALLYPNKVIANTADAFMRTKAEGGSYKDAGLNAYDAFLESSSEFEPEGVTQWSETWAGEKVREQAYRMIHNPTLDPLLAKQEYTVPEIIAAETVTGLWGLSMDVGSDPLTWVATAGTPERIAKVLGKTKPFKALKRAALSKKFNAELTNALSHFYLDVGTDPSVVEAYKDFRAGLGAYRDHAVARGKIIHNSFIAAMDELGFPRDHAVLYMLDALNIKKLEDVNLLPKDLRAPVLRLHRELRAKGQELFAKGYIEELLASDELYLPRATEVVSGKVPQPEWPKMPERADFKSDALYYEAANEFRIQRLKIKEYYNTVKRKRFYSPFGNIINTGFWGKTRKLRSAQDLYNHLGKISTAYEGEALRLNANIAESGVGALIGMNTRLMWGDLMEEVLSNKRVALKLVPEDELRSLPNGWLAVKFNKFPKPVKETLAGQLRYEHILADVEQLSENPFVQLGEAFSIVKKTKKLREQALLEGKDPSKVGEDIWLMEPRTFKFIQRMRRMNLPEARSSLFGAYMRTLSGWKAMATYLRLAFDVRNWTSGQEMAYLSGVRPDELVSFMPEVSKLLFMPEKKVMGYDSWKLGKLFRDNGIFGTGWIGSEMTYGPLKNMTDEMRRGYVRNLLGIEKRPEPGTWGMIKQGGRIIRAPFFATNKAAREASIFIEDSCRALTALKGIKNEEVKLGRKLSPVELRNIMSKLRDQVNFYHIDYTNLTPEMKALKPWTPFITFPVMNQPMLFHSLATKPERVARLAKFKNELFFDLAPGEMSELSESEYMRREEYRHIPYVFEKDGVKHQAVIHYGIDLPSSNMRAFWNLEGFMRLLSPVFTLKDIVVLGVNSFGHKLSEVQGERVPAPFWATWIPEDTLPMLDLGMMISPKTGKEVLGMNPETKALIETAFPFLSQYSRAFPQEGELFYEDQEGVPQWVGMTTGIKLRLMTDLDQARSGMSKVNRYGDAIRRLVPDRPYDSFEHIDALAKKHAEMKNKKKKNQK